MSFLGFDTSRTPAQRVHPQEARFGETPDNFAGLTSRTADANFDKGIDFEDTYDGLGDTLDETDDAFNEDTFGGASNQDFDFAGATAKVADVIHEEQVVYTRSNTKRQPIQSSVSPKDNKSIPAVSESSRLPALVPDMSLWGTSPNPSQESPHNEPLHSFIASPLPGKKFMSLEEVEAQILAMSPQTPPQPSVHNYRTLGSPNQLVMHHLQPQPLQHTSSPMDVRGFPQQLSQHVQQIMQHNQLTQCLQPFNQDRISSHLLPLPQQRIPQRDSEPIPLQARNQYGMTTHIPVQSLQSMTEADRLKFLEEESKRLKRNHKIAQLARFNGLMTPQDKNFIQRIQLQQLVSINNTDDNANEDFYYIVHSAIRARSNPQQPLSQLAQTYLFRHGGRGGRRQDNHLQRMEQQVARAVAAAKARPKASQLVLEGSLGKISFSNVKAPRPMLNIKKSDTGVEQTKKSSLVDRKSLLRAIESVYDALLELEIHQRDRSKLPPLQPGQPPLEAHTEWSKIRDQLAHKLYSETKINEPIDPSSRSAHPFIAILSFSKMKRAMPRIFRYLDPEQRVTVLTMIVVHLDILDVVKHGIYHPDETQLPSAHREEIDAFANHVLPPLLSYMYEASISVVIGLLAIMLDRVDIRTVSMTKIGLQFLTMFFSRAEILKQSSQMDDNDLHDWQVIYDRLFDTLNGRWTDCFPPSGKFVDDQYVWQFLASMAVGANMQQQQTLVASVKERVLENVQASKILPAEIGVQKRENVNLFMRAMGLDVDLLG
ncbi:topoisomerase II-associated protein PAT1 [Trichophaea hybrida]|nr:topoisomerase II-associated protein PAT1 [Trichophaea hybrida]